MQRFKYFRISPTYSPCVYLGNRDRTLSKITSLAFIDLNAFLKTAPFHEYCIKTTSMNKYFIIINKHFLGVSPSNDMSFVSCMKIKRKCSRSSFGEDIFLEEISNIKNNYQEMISATFVN